MAGSIKPNETPYKSMMISQEKETLNFQSLQIIEESIQVCEKFASVVRKYPEEVLTDFRDIDCSLVQSAIFSASV